MPNSFPQEQEANRFSYAYFGHRIDKQIPMGRWTEGASLDGKGKFEPMISEPLGQERGGRRMGNPVVLPVVKALQPNGLPDVVPANGGSDILLVPEESLCKEGRTRHGLSMGGIRGRAGSQSRCQLCL